MGCAIAILITLHLFESKATRLAGIAMRTSDGEECATVQASIGQQREQLLVNLAEMEASSAVNRIPSMAACLIGREARLDR